MRRASQVFVGLAIWCALFGAWGAFTTSGAHIFDEMDGMVPFFIGLTSGPLFICGAITWWLERRSRKSKGYAQDV